MAEQDIVERLLAPTFYEGGEEAYGPPAIQVEAAEEIKRLRNLTFAYSKDEKVIKTDRYRKALEGIACRARAALQDDE